MLTIAELRKDYLSGTRHPSEVIEEIFAMIATDGLSPVWISLADEERAVALAKAVNLSLPLAGIPFAVKDNIDVEGMPTTAACPSFAYTPDHTATVVRRLQEAGAILIGKTNMDQFATGLVGTRSPYGACSSVFNSKYISGGSSSGSAVAVAQELCAFALGTDTAGSGRVPAAFNNLVGMKPTRGLISTSGVVPACRSLDCVSVFALSATDASLIWTIAQGFDATDPYSRTIPPGSRAPDGQSDGPFRFGVPADSDLQFFGDPYTSELYANAIERMTKLGGVCTTIDFTPFREAAALLYAGPWVAERFVAVGEHIRNHPETVNNIVADIIMGGETYTAQDVYKAMYRLEELKRAADEQWARMDVLLTPTAGTTYTMEAVVADPIRLNSNLGYYTNFVNLLDLAAVALPAGFRKDGLPFGVSLIGPAFCDAGLLAMGRRFLEETSETPSKGPNYIPTAVVGAHLEGQPLNWQLTERGAQLARSCRTAEDYRLFALSGTIPPKPGLVREQGHKGPGIEVEVWNIPVEEFGSFVAAVPEPLAIGNVRLDTGEWVKGFVCEPLALSGATEITAYGGWRSYLSSTSSASSNEAAIDAGVAGRI
jgi:allophanate hydrolase